MSRSTARVSGLAKIDLHDACDAIEHLSTIIGKMTQAEQVDICARLRGVTKSIGLIDETIKKGIKHALKERDGEIKGGIFKAVLAYHPVNRLNQTKLKTEEPGLYAKYSEVKLEGRITFEPK